MYKINSVFILLIAVMLMSCNSKKEYQSYQEYPVYYGNDLELQYTPEASVFTVWSPAANQVKVNLYDTYNSCKPAEEINMRPHKDGTWRTTVKKDLKGMFYTFQVAMEGEVWLKETPGIWAKAVSVNGERGAVIDMKETNPDGWENDKHVNAALQTDIVIYEMHHRDFSVGPESGITNKGKYLALTEEGSKNAAGLSTGIDHLKELGVTHVHILPSFDFASIDETKLDENKYNWGYEPLHFNTTEGSFSTSPYDPVARIHEFKQMVQSLHKNNIGVIMDVVYNHTNSVDNSAFDRIAPGYFYRQDENGIYTNSTACGNETASERAMMRQYMIESVKYWANEYHIDGFRFDLMGVHDIETMNQLSAALKEINPSVIIYGEGWTAGSCPLPEAERATKANAIHMKDVAVFSDDIRDALKGHYSENTAQGFVSGSTEHNRESVKFGIVGAIQHPQIDYSKVLYINTPYANNPTQVINYVSCHDDLCLVDKLKFSAPANATAEELKKYNKLAQTVIFTSQGIPFIRAGEELLHDKKGVHNSFTSPDEINQIDWSHKSTYQDMFTYYKNLIALRKAHPAFRIPTAEGVRQALQFMEPDVPGVIAYQLKDHANGDSWKNILVILNGNRTDVKVAIPEGEWTAVCKNGKINPAGLEKISGSEVLAEASSAIILFK